MICGTTVPFRKIFCVDFQTHRIGKALLQAQQGNFLQDVAAVDLSGNQAQALLLIRVLFKNVRRWHPGQGLCLC